MESCDLNYSQHFFMALGFLPVLFCFPCWVVAKFVYEPYIKKLDVEEDEVPFEYQYPLDDADNDGCDYKKSVVLANTPKGMVYMRYCEKDLGFEYWADNSIDYKYLETVARKYVTIFSCRDTYINRFGLLKEKIQKIRENIEENKDKEEEVVDDVFATLKSYNKSKQTSRTELTRNDVVCDEANKYLNRGKLKDANLGEKPVEKISSLSFSSWKLWSQTKVD